MFFSRQPNREVYKSAIWRSLNVFDKAHIILVAEGVKNAGICGFTGISKFKNYLTKELGIYSYPYTLKKGEYGLGSNFLLLPSKLHLICNSETTLGKFLKLSRSTNYVYYNKEFGKLLSYPSCCTEEYMNPTYEKKFSSQLIKQIPNRLFTFYIECVKHILEDKEIPEEFNYLMSTQTPCSIECEKSKKLLRKWKYVLDGMDPETAEIIVYDNKNYFKTFEDVANQLRKKGIKPKQFDKGYLFT